MNTITLIGIVEATFKYFIALGKWHQDPEGVEAVRRVKEDIVADLKALPASPSRQELDELFCHWRSRRIDFSGEATYPPDMFIESVCEALAIT